MRSKRVYFWGIAGVTFGVLSLLALMFVAQSYRARHRAGSLNNALRKVTVGVTAEKQARDIFSSFRAEDEPVAARVFDTVAKGPAYVASNRGLSILHLAEPARFYVSLFFSNGIVVSKAAGLRVGAKRECCFFDVHESADSFTDLSPDVMRRGIFAHEEEGLVSIHIGSRASQEIRRAAFNFNFACLTSISGCRTLDQTLPDVSRLIPPRE